MYACMHEKDVIHGSGVNMHLYKRGTLAYLLNTLKGRIVIAEWAQGVGHAIWA